MTPPTGARPAALTDDEGRPYAAVVAVACIECAGAVEWVEACQPHPDADPHRARRATVRCTTPECGRYWSLLVTMLPAARPLIAP